MENPFSLSFDYDQRGFGKLVMLCNNIPILTYEARSGSINAAGQLVNAIRPDQWHIIDPSVHTDEIAMVITPGKGRKVRLWLKLGNSGKFERTHFLIHPDGNLPGSAGCVVTIKNDAEMLFIVIDDALKTQKVIPVYVTQQGAKPC